MANADKAKVEYEAGQEVVPMSELTDSGDRKTFAGADGLWSGRTGYEYDIKPNGLATGGAVIPAVSGSDDVVDGAALSCYLAGVKVAVSAALDLATPRAATQTHIIHSITVNSGGSLTIVNGTESTAFSETRAAAGGPPLIPVDSIEVAQVRLSSGAVAPVASTEILAVPGVHQERWDYPVFEADAYEGEVAFASALTAIHTGSVAKKVFASYATPVFAEVSKSSDFKAPETSYSVSSQQVYNANVGSVSSSLNQGGFNVLANDGITDSLVKVKGEKLWFRFYPDRNKIPHLYCQGILGVDRNFPASSAINAACTISAESEGVEVEA